MKYKTIVIDPAWKISNCDPNICTHGGIAKKLPYKTMTDQEIMQFPINDFADEKECDLFLWTTKAKIHTAFHVLEHWDFHYANFFVWNKLDGLNHHGVHAVLEFVLYAYRGRIGLNYQKPIDAYFAQKRKKHSQKPDVFYNRIIKVTQAPRIDIFARKRHYGFDAYGDQVETQIEYPLLISTNGDKEMQK